MKSPVVLLLSVVLGLSCVAAAEYINCYDPAAVEGGESCRVFGGTAGSLYAEQSFTVAAGKELTRVEWFLSDAGNSGSVKCEIRRGSTVLQETTVLSSAISDTGAWQVFGLTVPLEPGVYSTRVYATDSSYGGNLRTFIKTTGMSTYAGGQASSGTGSCDAGTILSDWDWTVRINVEVTYESSNYIKCYAPALASEGSLSRVFSTGTAWGYVEQSFTVPAGSELLQIEWLLRDSAISGSMVFEIRDSTGSSVLYTQTIASQYIPTDFGWVMFTTAPLPAGVYRTRVYAFSPPATYGGSLRAVIKTTGMSTYAGGQAFSGTGSCDAGTILSDWDWTVRIYTSPITAAPPVSNGWSENFESQTIPLGSPWAVIPAAGKVMGAYSGDSGELGWSRGKSATNAYSKYTDTINTVVDAYRPTTWDMDKNTPCELIINCFAGDTTLRSSSSSDIYLTTGKSLSTDYLWFQVYSKYDSVSGKYLHWGNFLARDYDQYGNLVTQSGFSSYFDFWPFTPYGPVSTECWVQLKLVLSGPKGEQKATLYYRQNGVGAWRDTHTSISTYPGFEAKYLHVVSGNTGRIDDIQLSRPTDCNEMMSTTALLGHNDGLISSDLDYDCYGDFTDYPLLADDWQACTKEPFRIGWYDRISMFGGWDDTGRWAIDLNVPSQVADEHCNIILNYNFGASEGEIAAYLRKALLANVKVILEIDRVKVAGHNLANIQKYVNRWKNHPAVYGWYLADEPGLNGADYSVANCEFAYDAIKAVDNKPVFIVFSLPEANSGAPASYQNAYDVLLFDYYPTDPGTAEFGNMPSWTSVLNTFKSTADTLGKTWWMVGQAFGDIPNQDYDWRLPTYQEQRYMLYSTILKEVDGMLFWARYVTLESLALSGEAYPYSGQQWIVDVQKPLMQEFSVYAAAIGNGPQSGAVTDNSADIEVFVFPDGLAGTWYLVAVNTSSSSRTPTFTINLSVAGGSQTALPMGEGRSAITITSTQFSDSFSPYKVHVYKLNGFTAPAGTFCRPIDLLGDTNKDGTIDLNDLAGFVEEWLSCTDPADSSCN